MVAWQPQSRGGIRELKKKGVGQAGRLVTERGKEGVMVVVGETPRQERQRQRERHQRERD